MICERPIWELIKDAATEPSSLNGGRNRRMVRASSATCGRRGGKIVRPDGDSGICISRGATRDVTV
jgi:hypothetical protein